MSCKGKCRFELKSNRWTYVKGHKRCTVCEKEIDAPNDLRCYCCRSVLRIGAQQNEGRKARIRDCVRF